MTSVEISFVMPRAYSGSWQSSGGSLCDAPQKLPRVYTVWISHARTGDWREESRRGMCAAVCPRVSVSMHRVFVLCMCRAHG